MHRHDVRQRRFESLLWSLDPPRLAVLLQLATAKWRQASSEESRGLFSSIILQLHQANGRSSLRLLCRRGLCVSEWQWRSIPQTPPSHAWTAQCPEPCSQWSSAQT